MAEGDPRPASDGDFDELVEAFVAAGHPVSGDPGGGDPGGHGGGHGGHGGPSVRVFEHRGHQVRIATHYEVTIDGEPWDQPIAVDVDGNVSYHGLPQYLVPSAVELVQAVIDHGIEAPPEIRRAIEAAREEG